MQVKGAIEIAHRFTQHVAQLAAPQALERAADQLQAHSEQLPRIAIERLDAAALIQYHQAFIEHFEHGLLLFQQPLQRHLA